MRKRTLSLILALVLAFSVITGNTVPVFGESTESSAEDREYEEGEILVLYQPDKFDSVQKSVGIDRSGSDSAAAIDLMAMSEDLMDVSDGAAAIEAEQEGPKQVRADGFSGYDETTVIKLIKSDRYSTKELLDMYKDYPGVLCAEPNYIGHITEDTEISDLDEEVLNFESITPAGDVVVKDAEVKDPDLTGYQYAYGSDDGGMDVPDWGDSSKKNAEGTVVAIVDTGVDYNHPDLKPVMWDEGENYPELVAIGGGKYGFNAAWNQGDAPSSDPMDVHSHGTHCAGIVAAAWNDFGVSGIANGAKIMAVRHTNSGGANNTANTLKAFNYIKTAKEAGVNVVSVNNSWAAENCTETILGYAIRDLEEVGVVSCMASSNMSSNNDIFAQTPTSLTDNPGAIIVNASTNGGTRGSFSDYGIRSTHIFAPGADIMSTYPLARAEALADMNILPPTSDVNGNTAGDDFSGATIWFTIESDTTSSSTCTVVDGDLQVRNTILKSYDNLDGTTRETTELVPPTDGYLATVCTLRGAAAVSSDKPIYFGINAKTTPGGAADQEILRMYMKTTTGKWDRPAFTPPLKSIYDGMCYKLDKGVATGESFDLDNIEIRLVAYNAASTFENIDINQIWFTDSDDKIAYHFDSGTSMATPAVAGEVAVLAAKYPGESAAKRAARVLAGARLMGNFTDDCITGGMANVRNSLNENTYTPVITDINTYWDGLHLSGFFFGDKENTEVSIKQGDITFTTTDDSLKVLNVRQDNGGQDILLSMPQALKAGEVTVTVKNKAAAAGRTDYTRIMKLYDPEGFLSLYYPQLPAPVALKEVAPTTSLVEWNGSLIVTGYGNVSNTSESWICTPAGYGTWSKLPAAVDKVDNGNVITWNQKLLYINNKGELCIHDPLTGNVDKKALMMNERGIAGKETCVLYYDGERVILAWTPITDEKAENTQIWEVSPGTFKTSFLGTLEGAYGSSEIEFCAPVIAHTTGTDDKTNAYYVFGLDEKAEDYTPKMERFTVGTPFTSEKVALKYPEGGEMVFVQDGRKDAGSIFQLFTGGAFAGDNGHGAMMLTGMFRTNDSLAGNAVIYDDNYFINLTAPNLEVMPSTQKVSSSKVFNSVVCAYNDRAYIMGSQESNSGSLAFAYTMVQTWPAYGDQVNADPEVKVKKLTLSKTKVTLEQGMTMKLTAEPVFTDPGTYAVVVYTSSNSDVAAVDADGTVHAVNAGTAVITASCGDKTATCTVTVDAKAVPALNKTETTLKEGEKDLLILNNAIVTGKEKVTWKSSNSKIVAVNKGLLTAKKAGNADIYATWKCGKETRSFTCNVTVEDITVPKAASDDKAVKLSVGKSSVKLNKNDTAEITAKLKGADLAKRNVDLKSLNPNVVDFGEAGDSVTLSGNALVKAEITGRGAGIAYVIVESYDPSVDSAVKNRKLVKVTVNAPAESIEFTGVSNDSVEVLKGDDTIIMKAGSVTAVNYKLSPDVCTDFSKVKWSVSKGGTVTVRNGVITAKKASAKDGDGNYIPSIVTATCGKKTMTIRVIVE